MMSEVPPSMVLAWARRKPEAVALAASATAPTRPMRDLWMHRIDAARVVGRELVLTPEHDGRIVADVVAEWARRHGMACTLELTGPAGGSFHTPGAADAGERHTLDAVEFCRILAGRSPGEGLLATIVPF